MSGARITIQLDATAAIARLAGLIERMERPEGFFKNAGEYLTEVATPRNFATETAPDGTPWARLSEVTIKRREAKGQVPIRILRASGSAASLSASITYQIEADRLMVGTNAQHAGTHQFGAAKGAFGSTRRGGPIPWGNIPARPFLGLSDADEVELVAIAEEWLSVE